MRPYWTSSDRRLVIYHADARDVLPEISDGSADLVLTDPPYGIGKAEWDTEFPTWWMEDATRIAPVVAVMPGTWNLLKCPQRIGRAEYKWTLSAHLTNGMTRGGFGFGNWIPCVVYRRSVTKDMPEDVQAWCRSFAAWCADQGITKRDLDRTCGTSDMGGWWLGILPHRCQVPAPHQWAKIRAAFSPPADFDALTAPHPSDYQPKGDCRAFAIGLYDKPDHPSPKPLNVVRWFLESLPGGSVLDPFLGSGTTLLAAQAMGYPAIGVEIEERYAEIAARRLEDPPLLAAVKAEQGDLFGEVSP